MPKAPGKSDRVGISLIELAEMFPTEESAVKWFEDVRWPEGRTCPKCGNCDTSEVENRKPMPYWCGACRSYFSVRTGTSIESSRLPMRKWAFAVYIYVTSLKSVSSLKLHRDLKVTQKTAWFMLHRLRDAWSESGLGAFVGPAEADETYIGGKRKNMSKGKRKELKGRGTVGKAIVVGVKDRDTNKIMARKVEAADAPTLQRFVRENVQSGATLYTDEAAAYKGIEDYRHEAVNHSVGEYVRDMAHTNGMESFWSMLKRGYVGTFHHFSEKHLGKYVAEFAGKHNIREMDTVDQMISVVTATVGNRLMYKSLIAD